MKFSTGFRGRQPRRVRSHAQWFELQKADGGEEGLEL
jgi:hypothetical protein